MKKQSLFLPSFGRFRRVTCGDLYKGPLRDPITAEFEKTKHAGADRNLFLRERHTVAITPAIRRVWKHFVLYLHSPPFARVAITPAIRRVWKQIEDG